MTMTTSGRFLRRAKRFQIENNYYQLKHKKGKTMSGTKAGGLKARATNYERHGKDFYKKIGAKGGRNGHTGGFAANPALARIAGAKGGRISRRGPGKSRWKNTEKVIRDGKEVTKINVKYIPTK